RASGTFRTARLPRECPALPGRVESVITSGGPLDGYCAVAMTVTTVTGAPAAVTVPATTPRTMKMLPDGNSVAQPTTSSNDVATATLRMEARRDRGVRHKKGAPGSLGAEEGTLPPPV